MSLKEDIKQAIDDSREEWFTALVGDDSVVDTQILTDKVWAALEDKLGAVQEKLLRDLGHARTQRDQAVNREGALRDIVVQQGQELDRLRAELAAAQ